MDREDVVYEACPKCHNRHQIRLVVELKPEEAEIYVRCEVCGMQGERSYPYEYSKRGMGLPDAFDFMDCVDTAIEQAVDWWNEVKVKK